MIKDILMWVFALMATIAISVATFSLSFAYNTNAKLAVMESNIGETDFGVINEKLNLILSDNSNDEKQDKTLTKQWKYLSWCRNNINYLRHLQGLEPEFPDLGE